VDYFSSTNFQQSEDRQASGSLIRKNRELTEENERLKRQLDAMVNAPVVTTQKVHRAVAREPTDEELSKLIDSNSCYCLLS